MTSSLPWTTRATLSAMAANNAANVVRSGADGAACSAPQRSWWRHSVMASPRSSTASAADGFPWRRGRRSPGALQRARPATWRCAECGRGADRGRLALAVDIGGTKLAAGRGRRRRRRGGRRHRPDAGRRQRRGAVRGPRRPRGVARRGATATRCVCGVGCGGPMAPGGETVSPLNIPAWRGLPAAGAAGRARTGLPTFVDNDAKALALGEGWLGAAAGERNFIAMVVSTGVGGGIVLDGRLLDGAAGNAGHIGHVIVEPDGRECALRRARLPRGRGVGHGHRRDHRRAARPRRPRVWRTRDGHARRPGRRRRWPTCSTSASPSSAARSPSATATPFFAAAQAELDAVARLSFSTGTRVVRPGLGAWAPLVGGAAVGFRSAGRRLGCVEPPDGGTRRERGGGDGRAGAVARRPRRSAPRWRAVPGSGRWRCARRGVTAAVAPVRPGRRGTGSASASSPRRARSTVPSGPRTWSSTCEWCRRFPL